MDPVDYTVTALTVWREARGESIDAQRGVLYVILNRCADKRWPNTAYGVCLQPLQFSSFNSNDPQSAKWPTQKTPADVLVWKNIRALVDRPGVDPTNGANHYYDVSIQPPSWADETKHTATIGRLRFFKL